MRARISLVVMIGLAGGACAGGMKHQVNDRVLGDVSMEQKQGMLDAKGEMDRVAEEKNQAQANLDSADRDLAVAQDGYKQARLEIDKTQQGLGLEKQRGNLGPMQDARDQRELARLGADTAKARVEWFKRRHDLRQAELGMVEARAQLAGARYEQQKALLAERMGKQPSPGFKMGDYDRQVFDMQRRCQEAQARVDKEGLEASQLQREYGQLVSRYNQLRVQYIGPMPIYPSPPNSTEQSAAPAPPVM